MEKQPLTSRQKEILELMESFLRDNGYPPTVREICKASGLRSPRSVSQHLQALERKGYIERGRDKSRAIRFLHAPINGGASSEEIVRLPLMGKVAAGATTSLASLDDATYCIDRHLVEGDQSFLMKVEGDSMLPALATGQYVLLTPSGNRRDPLSRGDIVVVRQPMRNDPPGTQTNCIPVTGSRQVFNESARTCFGGAMAACLGRFFP
ncbi:MAG: repressor LexA [Candidatus Krumholzibacteriota bacterium]|nr:repressor LexA [Candidatus Krumholzibacteriota bacterium]